MTIDVEAAKMLIEAGISLKDPAPALAKRVVDKHHFRAFILATPVTQRRAAYDAMKPHLAFKVPSFSMLLGVGGKKLKKKVVQSLGNA